MHMHGNSVNIVIFLCCCYSHELETARCASSHKRYAKSIYTVLLVVKKIHQARLVTVYSNRPLSLFHCSFRIWNIRLRCIYLWRGLFHHFISLVLTSMLWELKLNFIRLKTKVFSAYSFWYTSILLLRTVYFFTRSSVLLSVYSWPKFVNCIWHIIASFKWKYFDRLRKMIFQNKF